MTPDARARDLERRAATDPDAAAALERDRIRRRTPEAAQHGDVIFRTPEGLEPLRLRGDGTILVNGEVACGAVDVVAALRAWLTSTGITWTPQPGAVLGNVMFTGGAGAVGNPPLVNAEGRELLHCPACKADYERDAVIVGATARQNARGGDVVLVGGAPRQQALYDSEAFPAFVRCQLGPYRCTRAEGHDGDCLPTRRRP